MRRLRLDSEQDMLDLAAVIQPVLCRGDLLVLSGEIGAGKTFFVRALARQMGIEEAVTSPTFTLLHSYEREAVADGPPRLHHMDLYRLADPSEVLDLDLPDCLDDDAVTAIEWGERAIEAFPHHYLRMTIDHAGPTQREVTLEAVGGDWVGRLDALELP